jgi:hypothetical protein
VAISRDRVFVRDSKDLAGPVLEFAHEDWRAFLGIVRYSGRVIPAVSGPESGPSADPVTIGSDMITAF